jgi:hypothetical protein
MNLSLLRNTALFADLDEAQLGREAETCLGQTYRSRETILRPFVRLLSARLRATNDNLRTFLAMSMF